VDERSFKNRPSTDDCHPKLRWLRKFDTGHRPPREIKVDEYEKVQKPLPQNGCNVELTRLTMPDDEQWLDGLMQGRWTAASWSLASEGGLAFRREEAERMRAGLQKFQAPNTLPVQQPTLSPPDSGALRSRRVHLQDSGIKANAKRIVPNRPKPEQLTVHNLETGSDHDSAPDHT